MNVDLCSELNKHLWIRVMAKDFFNKYHNNTEKMIVSFRGIKSISRGFIQEYLKLKENQNYKIIDIDIPTNIEKMFSVVINPKPKPKLRNYYKPQPLIVN